MEISKDQNRIEGPAMSVAAVDAKGRGCADCALRMADCTNVPCEPYERADNRDIIFIKSE